MTSRDYDTLGVVDWVTTSATGLGEAILNQDFERRFASWRTLRYTITPAFMQGAIAHLEAGPFTSYGDAPALIGLAAAGLPAGSPESDYVYAAMSTAKSRAGSDYDHIEDPYERLKAIEAGSWAESEAAYERGEALTPWAASYSPGQGPGMSDEDIRANLGVDNPQGLLGIFKGTSRWGMLIFDVIPEGLDALTRAVTQVKAGNLNPWEAAAGMLGIDREAGQLVGIPLFQYGAALLRGERLNMGTGWFPTGDIAPDIQAALNNYDAETNGVADPVTGEIDATPAREHYLRLRELARSQGTHVTVVGPDGAEHRADNFTDWQWLRNSAGRAALLADLQYQSPTQAALGQAYGTFNESVLDEGTIATVFDHPGIPDGGNRRITMDTGEAIGAVIAEPGSAPFHAVSGGLNFGKQLLDLNLVGLGSRVSTVINRAKKFIGSGSLTGDLIRGSGTAKDILRTADPGAYDRVLSDLTRGTLNRDLATNALNRVADPELATATRFLSDANRVAPHVLNGRRQAKMRELIETASRHGISADDVIARANLDEWTPNRIEGMLSRAAGGDQKARTWVAGIIDESTLPATADDALKGLDTVSAVQARPGVNLIGEVYGTAQVDEAINAANRARVDELADLLEGRRGSFVIDRAKVYSDVDEGLILSFDADLGRAQGTIATLGDRLADRADVAKRTLSASQRLDAAKAAEDLRQYRLAQTGVGRGLRGTSPELAKAQSAFDAVADEARAVGLDPTRRGALEWAAKLSDPEDARAFVGDRLFKGDNNAFEIWASNALGATDDAYGEVQNLKRVLRRNEAATDLVDHIADFSHVIPDGELNDLLRGGGAMEDLVTSILDAKTIREVEAILSPTKEFMGRTISPKLVVALKRASTKEEVVEAFIAAGDTAVLLPQRIGLIGTYQQLGTKLTLAGGAGTGALAGLERAQDEDAGWGDILGEAVAGAFVGALGGSAISGLAGWRAGALTRKIEDVSDLMDLTLAGTRATTTSLLTARGVPMSRAQAGLSAPAQLAYGLGHGPWGRRLARSYRTTVDVNDPYDLFYTMSDMTRSFGVQLDDEVTRMLRKTDDGESVVRIIRSNYDSAEAYQEAITQAGRDGYSVEKVFNLDRAMSNIADLQANTPAAAWIAMEELFDGIDNILVSEGMDPDLASVLTSFAREGKKEFVANVGSLGNNANYAQGFYLNGDFHDLSYVPKLTSEMWTGHIQLPRPDQVHRAVGQLDALGRIGNVMTGRGVLGRAWDHLKATGDETWSEALRPSDLTALERNTAATAARAITSSIWAPMVLATRPMSLLSRVLGEDQARMLASGLDNILVHPFNFITTAITDRSLRRAWDAGRIRGLTARSLIPSGLFDESGRLVDDYLDRMHHLQESERVKQGLGIYDADAAKKARNYGRTRWDRHIERGDPLYLRSVAGEYRQLLTDPLVRQMARSQADDVVDDTLNWLLETTEGRATYQRWLAQFEGKPEVAAQYINDPEAIRAFLNDQHARLHLKTGGDWVFVTEDVVLNSGGAVINNAELAALGLDANQLDNGYHIIRGGDPDMIDTIARGKIGDVNVMGDLNDEALGAIQDYVRTRDEVHARTGEHRFPAQVKGELTTERGGFTNYFGAWDDALDRFYDWTLGGLTNRFSRQPVLGQYYWERVGLLYPSLTDELQTKFRSLAEAEGRWNEVRRVADAMAETSPPLGVIDNFDIMDLNAKAYAVERTKDVLFDLTRQRNFIEGLRAVVPFAGPMVEALEAWGRVIRSNPVYIWRRGLQAVDALWDNDPLSRERETGFGTFVTDENGERLFVFPFTGPIKDWMHDHINEKIPEGPITGRLRGFNVVFGPEDLSDLEAEPDFSGVPISALDPGFGPSITIPAAWGLPHGEGAVKQVEEMIFPYGRPANPIETFMPFHLRTTLQGLDLLGAQSNADKMDAAALQFNAMIAAGEVGPGAQYEWDISDGAGVKAAWDEAFSRAAWKNAVDGAARGSLPTMVTPEVYAKIDALDENGVNTEVLLNVSALQTEARRLYSEEGSEIVQLPNGAWASTEGDYEIITMYLNEKYGADMYSAELLTMSPSDVIYPRQFTEASRAWMRERGAKIADSLDLDASINFLMPDFAAAEEGEYDFDARDDAIRRGEITWANPDEYEAEIEGRLLSMRNREIDLAAERLFGPDDIIDDETKDKKAEYVEHHKAMARGSYERAAIGDGSDTKATNEILTWNLRDWEAADLDPREAATVSAVLWYLEVEARAQELASVGGVDDITEKGSSDEEKEFATAARQSVMQLVNAQLDYALENGQDMGNFPYLWSRYLRPRLEVEDGEPDPLADLAARQSPWGAAIDYLDNE